MRRAIVPLVGAALVFFQGCATVMSHGPRNGASADAQRIAAESLEREITPLALLASGRDVSVRLVATPGRAAPDPFLLYAGNALREAVVAGGGRYVGEEGGDLRFEVHAAQPGTSATERHLIAPVTQTIRVPLFYSEGFGGVSELIVVARDGHGNVLPRRAPNKETGETEYYLFRVIGPFRR